MNDCGKKVAGEKIQVNQIEFSWHLKIIFEICNGIFEEKKLFFLKIYIYLFENLHKSNLAQL